MKDSKELATAHWEGYVEPTIRVHMREFGAAHEETLYTKDEVVEMCRHHYESAFVHGFKHSTESARGISRSAMNQQDAASIIKEAGAHSCRNCQVLTCKQKGGFGNGCHFWSATSSISMPFQPHEEDKATPPREPFIFPCAESGMDLVAHLLRQREFSVKTFGPGRRTEGILDHIRKELEEIEAQPHDLEEWVDLVLLALDGAWRSGHTPEEIALGILLKQEKNENRKWPDWRTSDPNKAIEHDRSGE